MEPKINKKWQRGADLALQNANSLISDAELLAQNNSFGHATSLLILAGEELAKSNLLRLLALVKLPKKAISLSNEIFNSHETKFKILSALTDMENMNKIIWPIVKKRDIANKIQNSEKPIEMTKELVSLHLQKPNIQRKIELAEKRRRWWDEKANELKKQGFYVDKKNKAHWTSPANVSASKYRRVYHEILSKRKSSQFLADIFVENKIEENLGMDYFKEIFLSAFIPFFAYAGFISSKNVRKKINYLEKNKKGRIEIRPTN